MRSEKRTKEWTVDRVRIMSDMGENNRATEILKFWLFVPKINLLL